MTPEENLYYNQMQLEVQQAQLREEQIRQQYGINGALPNEDNLVKYQLDLKEEIDRIYHLLRGDSIEEDKEGNIIYVENKDDTKKPFNEFGVQLIMNIMSFYLNRNTLLSNYDEETILWKVLDFGREVSDLILTRYLEMGMDTEDKIKLYPMIIKELVDTIHSCYLRALDNGERESLRTARSISQHENIGSPTTLQPPKKFSLLHPFKWL